MIFICCTHEVSRLFILSHQSYYLIWCHWSVGIGRWINNIWQFNAFWYSRFILAVTFSISSYQNIQTRCCSKSFSLHVLRKRLQWSSNATATAKHLPCVPDGEYHHTTWGIIPRQLSSNWASTPMVLQPTEGPIEHLFTSCHELRTQRQVRSMNLLAVYRLPCQPIYAGQSIYIMVVNYTIHEDISSLEPHMEAIVTSNKIVPIQLEVSCRSWSTEISSSLQRAQDSRLIYPALKLTSELCCFVSHLTLYVQ